MPEPTLKKASRLIPNKRVFTHQLARLTGLVLMLAMLATVAQAATTTTKATVDNSADFVGLYTSLALDSSGFPVISYFDGFPNLNLKLAHCNDVICTTKTITTVDTGSVGFYTSLALDNSGFPVISYYDSSGGNLKLAHCNDVNCATKTLNIVDDGGTDFVGLFTSLALDNSGFPVISYYDDSNGALKLAHCNDVICTTKTITTVDTGSVGFYTSLALDNSGFPVISYYDSFGGNLKLAHCNDVNCATKTLNIVDDGGSDFVGLLTSLALDNSGFPVISYWDATSSALKLAHCTDVNCAGSTLNTVDPGGTDDVGQFTSLVLDSSGFPVISYYDSSNDALKLAHCTDVNCTGSTLNTVDPGGTDDVGRFTSLALDSSGFPVISYYDSSNSALKLVACDDPNCAGDESANIQTVDNDAAVGKYTSLALGSMVISYYDDSNGALKVARISETADPVSDPDDDPDELPATGFAPGRVTTLPPQPTAKAYDNVEMTLVIPSLDVSMPIVGVPASESSWDVTWLGDSAGYLSGSAFPTWAGNTVLTGHVWDSWNQPGPFSKLRTLRYGDQFTIQAWGQTYTYEVRENRFMFPKQVNKVFQHQELDWVTLVTCEFYNPFKDNYVFRRAVSAVLISVD